MHKYKLFQNKIDKKLSIISYRKKINYFGRANTAIWCIGEFLKKNSKKRTIILPSTMCVSPAIIFRVLGFKLEFVDVNKSNGLLNLEKVTKKVNKKKNDILCIFYVNLFGNKDVEAHKLKNFKKIFIIQDLAQTFFCKENIKNDIFGDLIILSFGYSKIFDLDHGGIVLSNNKKFYNYGIEFNEKIKNINVPDISKKKYLKWYNDVIIKNKKNNLKNLKSFASKIYLIKFKNKKLIEINNSLNLLSKEFKRRNSLLKIYREKIRNLNLNIIHSKNTFIPWRFSFLINNKEFYLKLIRKNGNDASSYYPNIGRVFSNKENKNSYVNSDFIQEKVINLWLTKEYNKNRIKKICNLLNEKKN